MSRRIRLCVSGFLFLVIIFSAFSQSTGGGNILFDLDMARFKVREGWSLLEVYFAIPRDALEHNLREKQFVAMYEISVSLLKKDSVVAQDTWKSTDAVDSLEQVKKGHRIYNQTSFYLKDGDYRLRARVTDLTKMAGGWYEQDFSVLQYSDTLFEISDIELGIQIFPDTSKNAYVKNGYRVIPNPGRIYGPELPVIFHYCEIYNLSPVVPDKDPFYTVSVYLRDAQENRVKEMPPVKRRRAGTSLLEVGRTSIQDLQSGTYDFMVEALDHASGKTAVKSKRFSIYRPGDLVADSQPGNLPRMDHMELYGTLSEEEIDKEFESCRYISTAEENGLFRKLDLVGKKQFMADFWRKRDPDALTPQNEYRDEYLHRVAVANRDYTFGPRIGWKSDRGRVFIMYGDPEEIERYPSSMDQNGYQIWHYFQIEGGVFFIFVDVSNYGDMRLVHSTARNELQDDSWERWLSR